MDVRSELSKEAAGLLDSKALVNLRELAEFRKVLSARRVRHWIEEIEREHCEMATRLTKIADGSQIADVLSRTKCSRCEYDESDGSLFNHCDACCRKIVGELMEAVT